MNFFVSELISKVSIVVLKMRLNPPQSILSKRFRYVANVQFFEFNQGQIPILTRICKCKSTANEAVQELDSCFKDNSGVLKKVGHGSKLYCLCHLNTVIDFDISCVGFGKHMIRGT